MSQSKPVYLMVRDLEDGSGGVEFGVDWGVPEGEELPEDVEDLNQAQFSVWKFICVLKGVGDADFQAEVEKFKRDKPSGIVVPDAGNA